jgi:Phosphoserine phosphatase
MNTYDFDKTIFYPDSSACFFRYCLRRYPSAVFPTLPRSLWTAMRYRMGKVTAKTLKQQLFSFLSSVPDIDAAVCDFWEQNEKRIGKWYLKQKRSDDLILSASPRFLLQPICDKLGVELIATEMNCRSGRIDGENCHDHEKVRRFYDRDPNAHTEAFFSDSLSDSPMADIADRAFLVRRHKLFPWPGK